MASILIVDDNRDQSQPLAALLRREGHEVDCADSAADALRHVRHRTPDLMLVDVMMPGTSGLEVLDALTDEPEFADIRFIVFSASDDPAFAAEAKRLGACDYIRKGDGWPVIHQRIRAHLPVTPPPTEAEVFVSADGFALPQ